MSLMEGTLGWERQQGMDRSKRRRGAKGPKGEDGAQGPQGATGPQGAAEGPHTHAMTFTKRTNSVNCPDNGFATCKADCLTGEQVTGGGGEMDVGSNNQSLRRSWMQDATSWSVSMGNNSGSGSHTIDCFVICAAATTSVGS